MEDFTKIYVQHVKDIYFFLLKLSGNEDVAEELTQATFAIAFEKIDQFKGECKLSVWLCQIAKHKYYEYYRKQKRVVGDNELVDMPHPGNIEEAMIDQADKIHIHEILHCIPEPYKEVFTLKVMGELSYKDISRLFGKTESWARVTYYRAKCIIIEKLRGEENEGL